MNTWHRPTSEVRRFLGCAVLLSLAISVALTAMALLRATVLSPLPYNQPGRLVVLSAGSNPQKALPIELAQFVRMEAKSYSAVEFFLDPETLMVGPDSAVPVTGCRVSAGLFSLLGVPPLSARSLSADGEVVLEERFARAVLGSATRTRGRSIKIGEGYLAVAGVFPQRFFFPDTDVRVYLVSNDGEGFTRPGRFVRVIARLKDGVTLVAARAELLVLAERFNAAFRVSTDLRLYPLAEVLLGSQRLAMIVLLLLGGGLVVFASLNVAQLQLQNTLSRLPEFAVRVALGATARAEAWRHVFRMALLSVTGTVLGGLLGSLAIMQAKAADLKGVVGLAAAHITYTSCGFAAFVSFVILTSVTVPPLLRLDSRSLALALHRGGPASTEPWSVS